MTLQELDELRRRRAEAAPALQAPPVSGVETVNPVAPGTKPKLPQDMGGEQPSGTIQLDNPDWSNQHFYQNLYETMTQKPISEDEEERRKRGAAAASAVGHLGNVLSSFSNLIFAGEAPSQTLPQVPNPDYLSFSDRLRKQREQYNNGLLGAINLDRREYSDYLNRLFQKEQADRLNEWKQKEYDLSVERNAAQVEQWNKQNELAKERLEEETRRNRALDNYRNALLSSRGTSGRGGSRTDVPVVLNTPNGYISMDMDKVNNATLSQLYNMLPQEIKTRYDAIIRVNPKEAATLYLSALGEGASQSADIADYLYNSGIGTYINNGRATTSSTQDWLSGVQPLNLSQDGSSLYSTFNIDDTEPRTNYVEAPKQTNVAERTPQAAPEIPESPASNETAAPEDKVPTDKYEKFLYDRKKAQEEEIEEARRKAKEKEEYNKQVREARSNKKTDLRNTIDSLKKEKDAIREFDVEKFIRDNDLDTFEAAQIRLMAGEDRRKRANIEREINRLQIQLNRMNDAN